MTEKDSVPEIEAIVMFGLHAKIFLQWKSWELFVNMF